mmetsp:Transcript_38615/g.104577  ORF Transcript_38615/g.104577 Transcript_38615/m.104577 type:complete len:213 (+) Transcript_38615:989-1627(+)
MVEVGHRGRDHATPYCPRGGRRAEGLHVELPPLQLDAREGDRLHWHLEVGGGRAQRLSRDVWRLQGQGKRGGVPRQRRAASLHWLGQYAFPSWARVYVLLGRRRAEESREAWHRARRLGEAEHRHVEGASYAVAAGVRREERPLPREGPARLALPPLLLRRHPRRHRHPHELLAGGGPLDSLPCRRRPAVQCHCERDRWVWRRCSGCGQMHS